METSNNSFDLIIIGSGPAGLTAGVYATRAALSVLILAGTQWGGQLMLTSEVDNYPGFEEGIQGPELMQKMRKQAERFGAVIKNVDADKVDFSNPGGPFTVTTDNITYTGRSVIIATGAQTKWLGLDSEQKLIGRGVSSCAPCDAPFFRNKNVVVVGGGDSAMEEALVLSKFASAITIVHRRDSFRASAVMQQKVKADPKISILWDTIIEEVLGDQKVTGIKLKNLKTNATSEMVVDGIFVAIGHTPVTAVFKEVITTDELGYIVPIDHTRTNVEGVFVAGDVHDHHYRQAITAAAFGCMAAMDCEKWLEGRSKISST